MDNNEKIIVLLRGINVGGHKKIPMAELRDILTKSGFSNVKTYIQSGNVVLQSSENDKVLIESKIREAIYNYFSFDVPVLIKSALEIETILANCPFPQDAKEKSYFMMLHKIPEQELVRLASEKVYDGEEYYILNDCIYFYCANGYGKAKFNMSFFEKKLQVNATSRNYRTMKKLLSLSEEN